MYAQSPQQPQAQQQTVTVRVQVIDMDAFTLDLQVPTYLKARDLTQRVARDAGLKAYWDSGRRRLYWLRARGRLLGDEETLADLGVIDGELVYLLPEPPPGSGVMEQKPDYPENRGYMGKGTLALLGGLLACVTWAVGWGFALDMARTELTVWVPGLALGLLSTGFARHAWGGESSSLRVLLTGMILFPMLFALALVVPIGLAGIEQSFPDGPLQSVSGGDPALIFSDSVGGLLLGFVGVFMGWLAWWGAVEALPAEEAVQQQVQEQAAAAVVQCAICGGDVQADVRWECQHACGRYFHVGCYKARASVYRGDDSRCAVCSAQLA